MKKRKEALISSEIIIKMTRETEKTKHVDSSFNPKRYISETVAKRIEKKEKV